MTNQLIFKNTPLETTEKDNITWITSSSLSKALGYSRADAVSNLYNDNKDEFTAKMAMNAKLTVTGTNLKKDNLLFTLRGCHLIAMLSRTEVAKEFRKWVLDILDGERKENLPNHNINLELENSLLKESLFYIKNILFGSKETKTSLFTVIDSINIGYHTFSMHNAQRALRHWLDRVEYTMEKEISKEEKIKRISNQ